MTPLARRIQMVLASGVINPALALSICVMLINTRRTKIGVAAEAKLCTELDEPPKGLVLPDLSERWNSSLKTSLSEVEHITPGEPDKISALVESIELETEQVARTKAMKVHGQTHYRFTANLGACDKCLADDGKEYPVDEKPSHHPHCKCETELIGESDE